MASSSQLSQLLGGASSGEGIPSPKPSLSAGLVLAEYRTHLLSLFTHFCGTSASLSLSAWLSFADTFDVCPGYLATDKLEEVFDEVAKRRTGSPKPGNALSFAEFQDALCHLAKAVSDKQWRVSGAFRVRLFLRYTIHISQLPCPAGATTCSCPA